MVSAYYMIMKQTTKKEEKKMETTVKMLVNRYGIKSESKLVGSNPNMNDMPEGSNHYKVTLRGFGRRMTISYSMGPALTGEPEAVDVLDCLISDSDCIEGGFDEFCGNCGYNSDSRKAEKIYRACVATSKKLHRFLGDKFNQFHTAGRE